MAIAVAACGARSAAAQCPDGSSPPCKAQPRGGAIGPAPNTIAVLYFDNLSGNIEDSYLADGLTEEIIVHLGQVRRLIVTPRSVVRRFRESTSSPGDLGKQFGAAYILTGAVRPAGNRLRVNAELVRTSNSARVWGEVFDRSSADLFAIHAEIGEAVATAIAGQLVPAERTVFTAHRSRHPEAYDLYLRGQFFSHLFTESDIRRALDLYEQAIARDRTFAIAYAATAVAWNSLADDWLSPLDAYPKARQAAQRALALDTSGTGLTALFWPVLALDRDTARAASLARRAPELDPRLAEAHLLAFVIASLRGDAAGAIAAAKRAWDVDTLSYHGAFFYSEVLAQNRHFAELETFIRRTRDLIPRAEADGWLGVAKLGHDDCGAAVDLLHDATETHFRMDLGLALVCSGRREDAKALLDSTIQESRQRYVNAYFVASLQAALGNIDEAFEWLERAAHEHTAYLAYLATDFRWDGIRKDQRFVALQRRLWR